MINDAVLDRLGFLQIQTNLRLVYVITPGRQQTEMSDYRMYKQHGIYAEDCRKGS